MSGKYTRCRCKQSAITLTINKTDSEGEKVKYGIVAKITLLTPIAMAGTDHAVFMGNLRSDVRIGAIKQNLMHMLHQIGITVSKHDIDITHKPQSVYAFVYFYSDQEKELVLDLLNSTTVVQSLDLSGLVKNGRHLKVAPKLERWQLVSCGAGNKEAGGGQGNKLMGRPQHSLKAPHAVSSQWSNSPNESVLSDVPGQQQTQPTVPTAAADDPRKTYTKVSKPPSEHYYVKREKSAPMFETLLKNRSHYGLSDSEFDGQGKTKGTFSNGEKGDDELDSDDDIVIPNNSKKSKRRSNQRKKRLASLGQAARAAASNIDLAELRKSDNDQDANGALNNTAFFHRDAYMLDELLGNETRSVEFKRGQGMYVRRQLQDHVAVYMSAFLNTDGGTLLVGVNDEGEVKGVEVDRQLEDRLRREIDATIKHIRPSVFPNMYRLDFVPVTDSHNQPLGDRKVIEICIAAGMPGELYQTASGEVYVRRDGSIQGPLQASDIQQWTRMMMYDEQRKKDNEIQNLLEKERQLKAEIEERRANEEKLTSQLEAVGPKGSRKSKFRLKSRPKPDSKVCSIL